MKNFSRVFRHNEIFHLALRQKSSQISQHFRLRIVLVAKGDEEVFIQRLHNISLSEKNADLAKKRKREAAIRKRLTEIDNLVKKSFEKNVNGILSDDMLANLLGDYQREKAEVEAKLPELLKEMLLAENQTADIAQEVESLKQYAEIRELNRKIVTKLIQAVYVSEPEKVSGQRVYAITIRYKSQSPLSEPSELLTEATEEELAIVILGEHKKKIFHRQMKYLHISVLLHVLICR
jgi:hypothetical protein